MFAIEPRHDGSGFVGLGVVTTNQRHVTVGLGGGDSGGAGLEQRVGNGHNVGRRAVVAREVQHHGVGPRRHQFLQQLRTRSVEAVDRLIGVTDAKEIGILSGHESQQGELERVDVLSFVHEESSVAMTKAGERRSVVTQNRYCLSEQEIKVNNTLALTEPDISIDNFGHLGCG